MIDVKKTITASIKDNIFKLIKLGNNNTRTFKKIMYLVILDDVYDWAVYLDLPQILVNKLKNLRIDFIVENPEFKSQKFQTSFKSNSGEEYIIKPLHPYTNVNLPQTNDDYKRVWDSKDLSVISELIPAETGSKSWEVDNNCEIKIVYYQNIYDPENGKTLEGEPNNIIISNLTTCEKMDVFVNRETNEIYILDTDCRWRKITSQGLDAEQVKKLIRRSRQGISKEFDNSKLIYKLTEPNGSDDQAEVQIASSSDIHKLL